MNFLHFKLFIMKIYFLRHGEGMDDVEERYGGWGDLPLSEKGKKQAADVSEKFQNKGIDLVLSSPLKRAMETAQIVSGELELEAKKWLYLKERNTYGLMCGEKKKEMKKNYPELYNAYENAEWVPGSETKEQLAKRIDIMVEKLQRFDGENIVAVTHGKVLASFVENYLNKQIDEKGDCCVLEVEIENGEVKFESADGLTFKE